MGMQAFDLRRQTQGKSVEVFSGKGATEKGIFEDKPSEDIRHRMYADVRHV